MTVTAHIAKHIREVHFGVNWTWSNLKDNLKDVTWQQAVTKVHDLNTIALLVYHIHYYVETIIKVLEGKPLEAHDQYSFNCPPVTSAEDWEQLVHRTLEDGSRLAELVAQLPDAVLSETFVAEKYGSYYRNLHGVIEHTHYHLGQIALIKKLIGVQKSE